MDSVKGWLKKKETFTIQLFISVWKKYHEKQHEIGSTAYIYILLEISLKLSLYSSFVKLTLCDDLLSRPYQMQIHKFFFTLLLTIT